VLGGDHPETLNSISNMGGLLEAQGKLDQAEPYCREAASGFEHRLGNGHWQTGNARVGLGCVLMGLERFAEAEEQLLAAERILREAQGVPAGCYEGSVKALIELYDKWHAAEPGQGYEQKAAEWRAKLAEWQATTQPATRPSPPTDPQPAPQFGLRARPRRAQAKKSAQTPTRMMSTPAMRRRMSVPSVQPFESASRCTKPIDVPPTSTRPQCPML